MTETYSVEPIGWVESELVDPAAAPKQGSEGGPDVWITIRPEFGRAVSDINVGDDVWVLTWLHRADRRILSVHPRDDARNPLTGVFSTRSSDRPNPIGLHRVLVMVVAGIRLRVGPLEAVDGTPVIDIKPVL